MERSPAVIPAHTRIDGLIETSADLVIEGRVYGELDVGGTLTVAAGATCRASARGRVVVVLGEVIGNITATEAITVAAGARVVGDLRAPDVSVHAAGQVDGKVDLLAPAPEATPIRRTPLAPRGRGPRRPIAPQSVAGGDGDVRAAERPADGAQERAAAAVATADTVAGRPRAIPKPPRPSGRVQVTQRPRDDSA